MSGRDHFISSGLLFPVGTRNISVFNEDIQRKKRKKVYEDEKEMNTDIEG